MTDVWELVHRERRARIDDLDGLTPEQWQLPSLCGGWTVHDVAAHLVDNARTTRLGIVVAMARARFDFDRQNDNGVAREKGATPAGTLDRLRAVAGRRTTRWSTRSGRPSDWAGASNAWRGSVSSRPTLTGPTARATRSTVRWCPSC